MSILDFYKRAFETPAENNVLFSNDEIVENEEIVPEDDEKDIFDVNKEFKMLIENCPSNRTVKKFYKEWIKNLTSEIIQNSIDNIF